MESKKLLWLRVAANERGSIIVVALLMVMLLAIVIIGGSRSSTTEVKIAANKRVNVRNFYISEALVTQAGSVLEDARENNEDALKNELSANVPDNYESRTVEDQFGVKSLVEDVEGWQWLDWKYGGAAPIIWPNAVVWENGNPNQATDEFAYIIMKSGVADGGSLDMSASRLIEFNLRGRSISGAGRAELSVGYRTRL